MKIFLYLPVLILFSALAQAQTPKAADDTVQQMFLFDKNKDGLLQKEEITDDRLLRLFAEADRDKNGVVSKEELLVVVAEDKKTFGNSHQPGFGNGGPGPQPGELLPSFLQEALALSPAQKKQVEELQQRTRAKLDAILTDDQKKKLKELQSHGPPGGGPPKPNN